jgi:hypothetical protein
MFFDHLPARTRRALNVLLIASIVVVAAISFFLTFNAVQTWDDFCRAALPKDLGNVIANVQENYLIWSGRWAVHGLYALTFPYIGLDTINHNLLLALSAVIWFTVFYIFLHIFFRKSLSASKKAFLAVLLTTIYWAGMPDPGDTWYWLTGSTEYQLPFLLMALSLLTLTSVWVTGDRLLPRIGAGVLGGVIAFVVTGLHEIVGLLLLGGLSIAFLLALARKRWDVAIVYGLVILVTAVGIMIVLTAPGTGVRTARDFAQPNSVSAGLKALMSPRTSPLAWLGDARLWCLTVLLVTTPAFLRLRPAWVDWKLPLPGPLSRMAVVVPLIGLSAVMLGTFAASFAQGRDAPPRVMNLLYAVLVAGWIASLIPIGAMIGEASATQVSLLRAVNLGAAVLLPVTLLIAPVTLRAVNDIPVIVKDWRPALSARADEIRQKLAAGETSLVLKPIEADPRTYRWDDFGTDPTDWKNDCAAKFYGATDLRTEAPPVSAPSTEPDAPWRP